MYVCDEMYVGRRASGTVPVQCTQQQNAVAITQVKEMLQLILQRIGAQPSPLPAEVAGASTGASTTSVPGLELQPFGGQPPPLVSGCHLPTICEHTKKHLRTASP